MRVSLAFAFSAAAVALFGASQTPHSTDLYWQIPEGDAVLRGMLPHDVPWAVGAPAWTDHEWLFEALAAALYRVHAFVVLDVLCALGVAAAPVLVFLAGRARGWHWLPSSFVALVVAGAAATTWSERPQTFALLAFIGLAALLWRGTTAPAAAFLLAAAWSNLHASGVLAPAFCLLFAAACVACDRRDPRVRTAAIAAAASFAGTFLTPNGAGLWRYAIASLTDANGSHRYITEWLPILDPAVLRGGVWWTAIVAAVVGATLAAANREERPAVLAGIVMLALTLAHARFVAFAVVAAAPLVAVAFRPIVARLGERELTISRPVLAVPVLLALAALVRIATAPALGSERAAADAASLVRAHGVHGVVFTAYEDEAYLAAFAALPVRVIIDAHGDPFDAATWADEIRLERAAPDWSDALARRRIGAVVLAPAHPLALALRRARGWRVAASTPAAVLFERR